jgi:ABC-type uncharacterized transport system permease subunit
MNSALSSLACHVYVIATLVYLVYLVHPWRGLVLAGRGLVVAGLAMHAVALLGPLEAQGRPVGLSQGLSVLTFLLLIMLLVVDVRYRQPVLGAFLAPLAVVVMVTGLLIGGSGIVLPADAQRPLLPLHVAIALLGVAALALATLAGALYLLMERQVKAKRFGLLFSRLPSLEFLDTLNRRLMVWGFIALSITLVTGVFFSSAAPGFFWQWDSKQVATLVAWGVFATLLHARLVVGWRGRRVAVLTMAGFCLLLVSLLSSYNVAYHGGG